MTIAGRTEPLTNWQSGDVSRLKTSALHDLIAQEYPRTPRAHAAVAELQRRQAEPAEAMAAKSMTLARWSLVISVVAAAAAVASLFVG